MGAGGSDELSTWGGFIWFEELLFLVRDIVVTVVDIITCHVEQFPVDVGEFI